MAGKHRGFAGLWGLGIGSLDARHLRALGWRPRGHLVMASIGYAGREIRLRRTSREFDEIGKKLIFRRIFLINSWRVRNAFIVDV